MTRLQRCIAMGVEKIVKKLHVELVILDDEDELGWAVRKRSQAVEPPASFLIIHGSGQPAPNLAYLLHRFGGPAVGSMCAGSR